MTKILRAFAMLLTASVLVLAACGTSSEAEQDAVEEEPAAAIKIGVLVPFTGALSEFGGAFQKAADLAGEHLAAGGYPVEIVYGDTETNPTAAVEAARKLVDVDQVHAMVGAAASSASLAVAEAVTIPKGVPQISYASTSPLLTILPADDGQDFLFRTVPSDALQGVVLAGVAVEQGYKNVAILYVNNPYGQGLKDNFQAAFEAAGGTVSAAVPHDEAEATSYVAELRKAIEGEPEVLLALSYAGHATIYLREAIENDFIKTFLFVDGTKSQQIIEAVGAENLEGMLGTAPGSADTPSLELFTADYQAKYGELPPLPFMTNVYDSVVIAALAALAAEVSREYAESRSFKSGDAYGELSDGVPSRINISRTPQTSHTRLNTWAFYAQDAWTIGDRLTLNLGVRLDGIYGYVPVQSSPAGTWTALSEQLAGDAFSVTSEIGGLPDWPMNLGPRLSFAYDLFGDGRAALKGGWGRYYTQTGSALPGSANPNAGASAWVGWNDLDGDKLVDIGPSGTLVDSPEIDLSKFEGFTGGASTVYDKDANRPFSDDISLGVDMTIGSDVSFSATYHRRHHRDSLGRLNLARPPSAYTLTSFECATCPQATYEVYELQEAYRGLQDSVVTSVDMLQSNYNGIALQLQKRLSNNWQILGGATFSSHKGVVHSPPRDNTDWNNPNRLINRENGSVLTDLPWVFNVAGSYQAPWDVQLGWNYRARAGNPLVATARATGLNQGSESIYAYERGEERTDAITGLLDFNVRKMVDLGTARFEVGVDAGNIFNSQPAESLNTTFGSRYLSPTRSLTPRIVRFTVKLLF